MRRHENTVLASAGVRKKLLKMKRQLGLPSPSIPVQRSVRIRYLRAAINAFGAFSAEGSRQDGGRRLRA